jgi:membrane protein
MVRLPGTRMTVKEFFVTLGHEWQRDHIDDVAGSVTFFAILALFPFLLFLLSLASLVIDPSKTELLIEEVARVTPPQVTQILGARIRQFAQQNHPGLLTFGVIAAVWSASSGITSLMGALNTVYGVAESRSFLRRRGIAFLMTLLFAVLAILAAAVAIAAPALTHYLGGPLTKVVTWLRIPVAGFVMMLLWATIYYVLPDVQQRFRFITPGSVIGVLVWLLASWGFSEYVIHFPTSQAAYGALGGVIVMLLWMWISAQVLLVGAEINAVIEHKSEAGKRVGAKSLAETGTSPTKSEVEEQRGEHPLPGHTPPVST